MKKNNTYLADDEFDLGDFIKLLWREKILILSISIIFGLAGYLYASLQPQKFKTEITFKNPPFNLFISFTEVYFASQNNSINIDKDFVSAFKSNFLSLDNLQTFMEESGEFGNFKGYLQSRNISIKKYFQYKISEEKKNNSIFTNKYVLFFSKELDGDIFLNNYAEFIKKKTLFDIKKRLQFLIQNRIASTELALKKAKLINLEYPIFKTFDNSTINEQADLLYKGSKILSYEIMDLNGLLTKLENEKFDFDFILDKPLATPVYTASKLKYPVIGIILALFLSIAIIFFKDNLRNY
jgi:LPS O-antigen subunit length determinant protein (WzzB/FepE family)